MARAMYAKLGALLALALTILEIVDIYLIQIQQPLQFHFDYL